jgi:environmental stress-induced protein Ves
VNVRVQRLPARERREQPWRNGAGVTVEVAREPADAGDEAYAWRVSIARLRGASAFSSFPGIDRTLQLLDGQVELTIAGVARVLSPDDPPIRFAGEDAVACRVLAPAAADGDARDLNVLLRRAARLRTLVAIHRSGSVHRFGAAATVLVVALEPLDAVIDGDAHALEAFDALRFEARGGSLLKFTSEVAARACVVQLARGTDT